VYHYPESGVTIADAIHSCLSFVAHPGWTDPTVFPRLARVAGKPFEECHTPQVACIRCREATGTNVLVRARGLTKRFGSFTAVDGIDFDLYRARRSASSAERRSKSSTIG